MPATSFQMSHFERLAASARQRLAVGSYRGRFAPSPTGPLHAGSLIAALASWLDARAHRGAWLVRIDDLDPPREVAGATADILRTLTAFGLVPDAEPVLASRRTEHYEAALRRLQARGLVFPCACSRRDIEAAQPQAASAVYPGTCRNGLRGRRPRAIRFRVDDVRIGFTDRAAGQYAQHLARDVGDFVLRRADGLWAYQLAVVVDDAEQGITDVVRGADLLDNTPRQIALQRALELPTPRYLHVPVLCNASGEKLSKQTGARALAHDDVRGELARAWAHLGFAPIGADSPAAFLRAATDAWHARWCSA